MFFRTIISVRNNIFRIFCYPLLRTTRAFGKLPFKTKQVFKKVVADIHIIPTAIVEVAGGYTQPGGVPMRFDRDGDRLIYTTLGAAPIVPSSPTPFTPSGLFLQGTVSFISVTNSQATMSARGAA